MAEEKFSRREILNLALASPLLTILPAFGQTRTAQGKGLNRRSFVNAQSRVVPVGDSSLAGQLKLTRQWIGNLCRSRLENRGLKPVNVKEVALFELDLPLPKETRLYGEGFQMLSQTGGTLGKPEALGNYTDADHYKLPIPANANAFYGLMTLAETNGKNHLLGFTSCRRFSGQFFLRDTVLQVVVDTEGLEIKPGEIWNLEEFTYQSGADRETLLNVLAQRLIANHPPLEFKSPPTGWCSWYCFGSKVTAQQVLDNLDFIAKNIPRLRYIQIDDGYQPAMGDWLETGAAFGGDVQGVLKKIRARGFEPAIWVAPFIAEEKSNLFQQHPDWFVKDADGKPLRSDKVTFGGWRSIREKGAWYALDGTHPEAQKHLETVFRTMRRQWGITYFKLDANFWGAIHGGSFYDRKATRVEAYRAGMRAVLKGAGDAFILGCNHPIWASLGLIHGSRSSNDIKRSWERFKTTAQQNLSRNWQNGRLWWNDPDAVVLTGDLPEEEFQFHATAIFASGGMILSGDDLTKISRDRLDMLRKIETTGAAARFTDDTLRVGFINLPGRLMICAFNPEDTTQTISFRLPRACEVKDYWSGESLGKHQGEFTLKNMPPRSARLLVCM